MIAKRPRCPECGCSKVWINGRTSAGKQQYKCPACSRVFVAEPYLDSIVVELVDRMLQEELPVPTIARIMSGHASKRWIYYRKKGELRA